MKKKYPQEIEVLRAIPSAKNVDKRTCFISLHYSVIVVHLKIKDGFSSACQQRQLKSDSYLSKAVTIRTTICALIYQDARRETTILSIIYYWSVSCSIVLFNDPIDCSPPGSSVHGILQARILEWVAIFLSRGTSFLRDRTRVSCISENWHCLITIQILVPGV